MTPVAELERAVLQEAAHVLPRAVARAHAGAATGMIINEPAIVAEVADAFERYERALLTHDADVLDAMFVASEATVRYGVAEIQHGIDEIRAFRAMQRPFARTLDRLIITTYGDAMATASTLFYRGDFPGQVGRQMQTWLKQNGRWRVAAAQVSMIAIPA